MNKEKIAITEVLIKELRASEYNPRKHSEEQADQLKESIKRFGLIDPIICNSAPERKNVIIGGHFRKEMAEELKMTTFVKKSWSRNFLEY
jgi:ParB-like chromosome segregation protein Spo0J